MATLPFVITEKDGKERQFDIFSLLLRDRIIFINGMIDDLTANSVVAQLLHLDSEDPETEICLYLLVLFRGVVLRRVLPAGAERNEVDEAVVRFRPVLQYIANMQKPSPVYADVRARLGASDKRASAKQS